MESYRKCQVILVSLSLAITCTPILQAPAIASQQTGEDAVVKLALLTCPELVDLLGPDTWFEDLTNPALTSEVEIRETQIRYRRIFTCLSKMQERFQLPETLMAIKKLTEYFVDFAGLADDKLFDPSKPERKTSSTTVKLLQSIMPKRELVDLQTCSDPAVVKLRDKVGLPAPKGFVYITYVRFKTLLPETVQPAFENQRTRAITLLCRYIIIKLDLPLSPAEDKLQKRVLPKTISHELVHAYINSAIGLADHSKLPVWFHEGCAIYLSGSGGTTSVIHTIRTFGGQIRMTYKLSDPLEYKEYKIVFDYLEAELGKEVLYALIKDTIQNRNVNQIYARANVQSFEQLLSDAEKWHNLRQNLPRYVLYGVLAVTGLVFWRALSHGPRRRFPPYPPSPPQSSQSPPHDTFHTTVQYRRPRY